MYRIFPTSENEERVPPTSQKFGHFPQLEKFSSSRLHASPQPPPRLTKQQFSSYNPIKTALLAVVIALAPFLF